MTYRVELTARAAKQLEALPQSEQRRIAARIDALADDPRPQRTRKLSGSETLYRIRVGDYRILYQIDDAVVLVLVIRIAHRRDAYR